MERRLQRKLKWTELPAVLAEGLLRLHGVGVELAESVFSSDVSSAAPPALGKAELIRKEGCAGWALARAAQI